AASRVRADNRARNSRQSPPEVLRDLVARPRALVSRHQFDLHLTAVAVAAEAESAAAPAAAGDDRRRFRHRLLDHLFQAVPDRLGQLPPGADGELRVDVALSFVGSRQQFGAYAWIEDCREHDQTRRRADDRRPVLQRKVDHFAVAIVESLESTLARTV